MLAFDILSRLHHFVGLFDSALAGDGSSTSRNSIPTLVERRSTMPLSLYGHQHQRVSENSRSCAWQEPKLCKHASLPESRFTACNVDWRDINNKRGGRQKFFSYVREHPIHAPCTDMGKSSRDKDIKLGSETAY